jgi:hypothetical protein
MKKGQSQRYTVKAVGRRGVGHPRCAVCGCTREMVPGSGVCAHQCFWMLPGWVAYNSLTGRMVFKDHRALPLALMHRIDGKGRRHAASFPKIVAFAVALGWSGSTDAPSQPTFIDIYQEAV